MRKFAMSDIHGSYYEMMRLLEAVKFNPSVDQLVIVGDLINRGPYSGEVLKEIKSLNEAYDHVHVTIGNHEEMMLWYIEGKNPMWSQFGGQRSSSTIIEAFGKQGIDEAIHWVKKLPLIFEDNEYVYAHAGFQLPYKTAFNNRSNLWLPRKEFYQTPINRLLQETNGKPVVHGHTPAPNVVFDGARIGIDLGAQVVSKGRLACVELTTSRVWEYDFTLKTVKDNQIKRRDYY
ncbi:MULTISPECIES: metallophosphoesterase [Bacillaceae]|uniref:metallophosphoesterase n=1 Tax=Bacillaceae TaxID=186817 RepID=UPI00104CFD3B|nr:metallophosphoesterase [Bacillus sp. CBEL-1]TDB54820.1 serine/threonine protein phosphatase [Bacillus sp. CBEL-1]